MIKLVPRQIIYQKKLISLFLKSFFPKKINFLQMEKLKEKLNLSSNYKIFHIPKARIGIYLALKYLISKGDKNEVIMSPFTIFDIINKVIQAGGHPIFVDSESKNSFNLKIDDIKKKINKKTVAIIVTHHSLNQSNFEEILKLCKKYDIKLIQDLAISINSKYDGKNIYNYGDFSVCSFNLFKFVSSIFGGLIITKDTEFSSFYKNQIDENKVYKALDLRKYFLKGLKYKILTNSFFFKSIIFWIIKFAILWEIKIITNALKNDPNPFLEKTLQSKELISMNSTQLDLIINQIDDSFHLRKIREKNYTQYFRRIKSGYLKYQIENDNDNLKNINSYINFPIFVDNKEKFSEHLFKNNIDHSKFYYRNCNNLKIFSNFKTHTPNLDAIENSLIFLPTHHKLNQKKIDKIINSINSYKSNS